MRRGHSGLIERWWKEEEDAQYADPLLKWLIESRNNDQHHRPGARHTLTTSAVIGEILEWGDGGLPGEEYEVRADGPWYVVKQGTVYESRRRPRGTFVSSRSVCVADPPAAHLGSNLPTADPMVLFELAFAYYAQLYETVQARSATS